MARSTFAMFLMDATRAWACMLLPQSKSLVTNSQQTELSAAHTISHCSPLAKIIAWATRHGFPTTSDFLSHNRPANCSLDGSLEFCAFLQGADKSIVRQSTILAVPVDFGIIVVIFIKRYPIDNRHLGLGILCDWKSFRLRTLVCEQLLTMKEYDIPSPRL